MDADQDCVLVAEVLAMGVYAAAVLGKGDVGVFRHDELGIIAEADEF